MDREGVKCVSNWFYKKSVKSLPHSLSLSHSLHLSPSFFHTLSIHLSLILSLFCLSLSHSRLPLSPPLSLTPSLTLASLSLSFSRLPLSLSLSRLSLPSSRSR